MEEISFLRLLQVTHHSPGRDCPQSQIFNPKAFQCLRLKMIDKQFIPIIEIEYPVIQLCEDSRRATFHQLLNCLEVAFLYEKFCWAERRYLFGELFQGKFTHGKFRRCDVDEGNSNGIASRRDRGGERNGEKVII